MKEAVGVSCPVNDKRGDAMHRVTTCFYPHLFYRFIPLTSTATTTGAFLICDIILHDIR